MPIANHRLSAAVASARRRCYLGSRQHQTISRQCELRRGLPDAAAVSIL